MAFLPIFRIVVLCISVVFAIIALGLSAHLTSLVEAFVGETVTFAVLALATACLTILTLPIMLIVDMVRKGAFTSMVLVELIWFGILWIMWLATAADAVVSARRVFPDGCIAFVFVELDTICHVSSGIVALAFVNFVLLFGYSVTLVVFAIISAGRGRKVWTSSVKQTNFLALVDPEASVASFISPRNHSVPTQHEAGPRAGPTENGYPLQLRQGMHPMSAEV